MILIIALVSLTDIVMILFILTTRGKDDLDFILIEGLILLSHDLDYRIGEFD